MRVIFIALSMLFCIYNHAIAADNKPWQAGLFDSSFDAANRQARLKIAQGLFQDLNALKVYLPALTPDQKKWLEAERSKLKQIKGAAFQRKLSAFSNSTEFELERFIEGLNEILEALKYILNKNVTIEKELFYWAYANWVLTDNSRFNEAILQLHSRKIVDFSPDIRKQFGLTYSDYEPWGGYQMYGRAIQEKIVLQLISGLKK